MDELQQAQELAAKAADAIWQFQNADIHYSQEFISNEEVELLDSARILLDFLSGSQEV